MKVAEQTINSVFGAGRALFIQTDTSKPEDAARLAESAQKSFGKIDIVLNNHRFS